MTQSKAPRRKAIAKANAQPIEGINSEWQLSQLVDAVAAEVDRAEDTLSLKSYARNVTFALKQLSLELEVKVRRDPSGRILFRTPGKDEASATVLKLDLAQMLQGQLHGLRKPLDADGHARELTTLPGITAEEVVRLNAIAIYSVDDLERYTQTSAMIAEVSRKSAIPDHKLRNWLHLPYIAEIKPSSGPPGSQVLIEGGYFGPAADAGATILFQGQPLDVLAWSDSRILARMPQSIRGGGALFAVIQAQTTNAVAWDVASVDLVVRGIEASPQPALAGEPVTFRAVLANMGESPSAPEFEVQWMIDDKPQPPQPHGLLLPGQESGESSTRFTTRLPAGAHQVRFIADPQGLHPDVNRINGSFVQVINVEALRELRLGDEMLDRDARLDPLRVEDRRSDDALGLIFRGLLGYQTTGAIEPNLGAKMQLDTKRTDGNLGVSFELDSRASVFHDGQPVTAEDVVYTYEQARNAPLWAEPVNKHIKEISGEGRRVNFVIAGPNLTLDLNHLFTLGIVSRVAHRADPAAFGVKPVGCGPFKVSRFDEMGLILDRFDGYYLGPPRVHRISMSPGKATDLAEALKARALDGIRLKFGGPVTPQMLAEIKDTLVVALKSAFKPAPRPEWICAQTRSLLERTPNDFDSSANAHLWYLKSHERGSTKAARAKQTKRPERS